jgi:hypothetical protein
VGATVRDEPGPVVYSFLITESAFAIFFFVHPHVRSRELVNEFSYNLSLRSFDKHYRQVPALDKILQE